MRRDLKARKTRMKGSTNDERGGGEARKARIHHHPNQRRKTTDMERALMKEVALRAADRRSAPDDVQNALDERWSVRRYNGGEQPY